MKGAEVVNLFDTDPDLRKVREELQGALESLQGYTRNPLPKRIEQIMDSHLPGVETRVVDAKINATDATLRAYEAREKFMRNVLRIGMRRLASQPKKAEDIFAYFGDTFGTRQEVGNQTSWVVTDSSAQHAMQEAFSGTMPGSVRRSGNETGNVREWRVGARQSFIPGIAFVMRESVRMQDGKPVTITTLHQDAVSVKAKRHSA